MNEEILNDDQSFLLQTALEQRKQALSKKLKLTRTVTDIVSELDGRKISRTFFRPLEEFCQKEGYGFFPSYEAGYKRFRIKEHHEDHDFTLVEDSQGCFDFEDFSERYSVSLVMMEMHQCDTYIKEPHRIAEAMGQIDLFRKARAAFVLFRSANKVLFDCLWAEYRDVKQHDLGQKHFNEF